MKLPKFITSSNLYKNHLYKYKFKHNFVIFSVVGATLVGSINGTFRMWGFFFCVIGNIYWIGYHKNVTKDNETRWIFIAYLIINSMALLNNYIGGYFPSL